MKVLLGILIGGVAGALTVLTILGIYTEVMWREFEDADGR